MRGAPHVGFSALIRRVNWRISPLAFGRPGRRCRNRHRQNKRKPARCQETAVSGFTIEAMQSEAGLLSLEDGELLPKSSGFQSELVTRNEEGANVSDHREGKRNHGLILLERHLLPE